MGEGSTHFVSRAPKLGYAGPLDGIRGAAVLMVLLVHGSYITFGSFAGSVDMFFVVSGFLIPTLLLEEDRLEGHISYKNFYVRRALRLFPALYTTLFVTLVGGLALGPSTCKPGVDAYALCRGNVVNDVAAAGLYVYHVVHPVHREVLEGGAPELRPLIHLWTLSVEEHFYVIVAVMMSIVIGRRLVKPLIVVFLSAWVFIGTARLLGHVGPDFAWLQRPDSLMLGVVVAMLHALAPPQLSARATLWLRRSATAAAAMLVVVFGLGTTFTPVRFFIPFAPHDPGDPRYDASLYWPRFGFSLCALGIAVIVFCVTRCPDHWTARVFDVKWLREVGRRSYCIYLVHVPLFLLMIEGLHRRAGIPEGAVFALYLVALPLTSEALHRYVERPGLKLKRHFIHEGASGR